MKKYITVSVLAFVLALLGFTSVSADVCGLQPDGSFVSCANGPIIPMPTGWVHYNPGEAGCPLWFSWGYKAGCMGPAGLK